MPQCSPQRFPPDDKRVDDNPPADPSADAAADSHAALLALSQEDKRTLLHIARRTLETFLAQGKHLDLEVASPALRQVRAVFVTLWRRDSGELRGCRGESVARRPLAEAVAHMTIASALDDPRFLPISLPETPLLRIDINALTPLQPILPSEVEVGRHGLMVMRRPHAGLLLPDVAVRLGWDRVQLLDAVCEKAGLPRRAWREPETELYGFESEEWGEEE